MRLVNVFLLFPVKAPWSTQYSESLSPKEGFEVIVIGDWLHIRKDGVTRQVISTSMVRCADVVQEAPPAPAPVERVRIDANATMTMTPEPVELPPPPVKRRGRPPKMR